MNWKIHVSRLNGSACQETVFLYLYKIILLNISTLTPATQRYVGSAQTGEVELHRQTPILSNPILLDSIGQDVHFDVYLECSQRKSWVS